MIYDSIMNTGNYRTLSAAFASALDFLSGLCGETGGAIKELAPGRYDLDNDVYYMVQEHSLKDPGDALFECHRLYADVQCIIAGEERIDYAPLGKAGTWGPYDEERDVAFADGTEVGTTLDMKEGMFAVFFPQDAHRPCVKINGSAYSRKIVMKVPISG